MMNFILLCAILVVNTSSVVSSTRVETAQPYLLEPQPPLKCNQPSGIACKELALKALNTFEALVIKADLDTADAISVKDILTEAQLTRRSLQLDDYLCIKNNIRLFLHKVYVELDAFEALFYLNKFGKTWVDSLANVVSSYNLKRFWIQQRQMKPGIKFTNTGDAYHWYKRGIEPMVGKLYRDIRKILINHTDIRSGTTVVIPTLSMTLSIIAVIRKSLMDGINSNKEYAPTLRMKQIRIAERGSREVGGSVEVKNSGITSLSVDTTNDPVESTLGEVIQNSHGIETSVGTPSKKRKLKGTDDAIEKVVNESSEVVPEPATDDEIVEQYVAMFLESLLQEKH